MSLRTRILTLFLAAAVVPMLVLGALQYSRSMRALETMIAAQNARVAERVAATIDSRNALLQSDLLLLAENVETRNWLGALARGQRDSLAAREADRFLRDAWSRLGSTYLSMTYRDRREQELYRLGEIPEGAAPRERSASPLSVSHAVVDPRDSLPLGTVTLNPVLEALVPSDLLAAGFGETGHGMVIDRASGRILYYPDPRLQGRPIAPLMDDGQWEVSADVLAKRSGRFRYHAGDTVRIASFVSLASPAWTVVVSGAVNEFAQPFAEDRLQSLAAFLAVALFATALFVVMLRRTTRSLEQLTAATAVVGLGNFNPLLPPEKDGEVGRLTASFQVMVQRVRETMTEIESSRQMVVLGAFAAQLSHEVRNPLTSIKLNLQKLERLSRDGRMPETAAVPLTLSLEQVARLDAVVRGVLQLGKARTPMLEVVPLTTLVDAALASIEAQAAEQAVTINRDGEMPGALVRVDVTGVKGALLNVLLNALHSMEHGGVLLVRVARDSNGVVVRVQDSGPGIPPAARGELFRPFYTTRETGTGLGLPLARRAVEESGGTLQLSDPQPSQGAAFELILPLVDGSA